MLFRLPNILSKKMHFKKVINTYLTPTDLTPALSKGEGVQRGT